LPISKATKKRVSISGVSGVLKRVAAYKNYEGCRSTKPEP
jgi:hypothetical protein